MALSKLLPFSRKKEETFDPVPPGLVKQGELDRGAYGVVYSGELDGKKVAIKEIHETLLKEKDGDGLLRAFQNECHCLMSLNHPNVVKFMGAYRDKKKRRKLVLVMEQMKENLQKFLKNQRGKLSFHWQLVISYQIADALAYLHSCQPPVLHRDLSNRNILIDEDGTVKISDFGQSKLIDDLGQFSRTTQPGAVVYMPPEALQPGSHYTLSVDIFSLGVLMLEIATQQQPQLLLTEIGSKPEVLRRAADLQMLSDNHLLKPLIIWCFQEFDRRPTAAIIRGQILALREKESEIQQIQTIQRDLEGKDGHIRQLQRARENKIQQLQTIQRELEGKDSHIRQLQEQLFEEEKAKEKLKEDVSEYYGDKERLEEELNHARRRTTDLEKTLESAEKEIEARKQNEAKITCLSAEEKGQLEKRIETLQECIQDLQGLNQTLEDRIATTRQPEAISLNAGQLHQILKDHKEEMLCGIEQLQTSKVNEDAMMYEHLQNEAIALKMKLKEEGMLRKKAEEEQRRIAGELVKMEKKWLESGSKSSPIPRKMISDVEGLLGQSSESVEGLQDKMRILVEEWSKISEHEPEATLLNAGQLHQIEDLKEEMLHQFEQLQISKPEATSLNAGQLHQILKDHKEEMLCGIEQLQTSKPEATSLNAGQLCQILKDHKEEMLHQFEQLQTSKQYQADFSAEREDRVAAADIFIDREKEWMEIRSAEEYRGYLDPTGLLHEEIAPQRNETVGELNTNGQHQSDFGTRALKALIPLFHDMPHEAVLSRNCWIPFGYDSITVDRQGGTFDLCSDGLTKLSVPRNAVQGETALIRYAIIGRGPFQLPPNYQLGSFVVYVYYKPEKITTPVTLSLPTWYGGDVVPEEPPPDGLSFAVAPHTLGLRDTQYTFQLVNGGDFNGSRVHDVSIDGHSSLYTIVFREGAKSLYLATHLTVKNNVEKNNLCNKFQSRIYVTYSSPTWNKIVKAVHKRVEFNVDQQFEFQKPSSDSPSDLPSGKLVCEVEETMGNGWAVAIDGCPELRQTEVSYEESGYTTPKELEGAVKEGLYPPNLTLTVVNNVRREEHPTSKLVKCTIRGADRPLQFSINVWERRDPSSPISPTPSLYTSDPTSESSSPPGSGTAPFQKTVKAFLEFYQQSLLDKVVATAVEGKLLNGKVIPKSLSNDLKSKTSDNYEANTMLFQHAVQSWDIEACLVLCDAMRSETGYPKMNKLGEKMWGELDKNKVQYEANDL